MRHKIKINETLLINSVNVYWALVLLALGSMWQTAPHPQRAHRWSRAAQLMAAPNSSCKMCEDMGFLRRGKGELWKLPSCWERRTGSPQGVCVRAEDGCGVGFLSMWVLGIELTHCRACRAELCRTDYLGWALPCTLPVDCCGLLWNVCSCLLVLYPVLFPFLTSPTLL